MKPRIFFYAGRWHVTEPGGEVVWHFITLAEAVDKAVEIAGKCKQGMDRVRELVKVAIAKAEDR